MHDIMSIEALQPFIDLNSPQQIKKYSAYKIVNSLHHYHPFSPMEPFFSALNFTASILFPIEEGGTCLLHSRFSFHKC